MISFSKEEVDANYTYEQAKNKFLQDNELSTHGWDRMLVSFPNADNSGDFYLDLDKIGSKQYVSPDKKEQLIQWMHLTEKLFM